MEHRRYKRLHLDAPIIIQGTDLQGNPFEEDTFTMDISAAGARFVSTHEYDKNKTVMVKVHLAYPLNDIVNPGDWVSRARIARIDNVLRAEDGKVKKQNIAVQFVGILGTNLHQDAWIDAKG